jgi:hypothetical protein
MTGPKPECIKIQATTAYRGSDGKIPRGGGGQLHASAALTLGERTAPLLNEKESGQIPDMVKGKVVPVLF